MRDKLRLLWKLEEIDDELQNKRAKLVSLDDGSLLKQRVDNLREEVEKNRQEIRNMRREMEDKELEARGIEERRRSMERRMYGGLVTNPKELESMEKETEMLRRTQDRLEERVLELMYAIEDKNQQLRLLEEQLKSEEAEYEKIKQSYEVAYKELSECIAHLEKAREELLPQLDPYLLERYQEIREREGGGIAKVERGVCGGCGVSISPRILSRLREEDTIIYCENCGRILFIDE